MGSGNEIMVGVQLGFQLESGIKHAKCTPNPMCTHTHTQHRFVVFHVEFKHGCQRKFDVHGHEVEPNFGQMGLVRTGYLHSSYSEKT